MAAWQVAACAQAGSTVPAPPDMGAHDTNAVPMAADPLAALIAAESTKSEPRQDQATQAEPATISAAVDPDTFVGPPDSAAQPLPPVVLFPARVGQFPAPPQPAADTTAAVSGEDVGESPPDAPPVLRSQLPADDLAGESVWRLGYSGRAAAEERDGTVRACEAGGTPANGFGAGLACRSTGEVKVKESLYRLDGGPQVTLVAQAKGTDATTVDGRPAAVDPYALVPQFYTAVSGLTVMDGVLDGVLDSATVWMGRRDSAPSMMSSGLLPPNSTSMRFGVDNAHFGGIGLNYQYTARADSNGQNLPSYHSLRTEPLHTNPQGSVQLGFTRVEPLPAIQDTGSAWWASAMHEQKGVLAGTNRLGFQFGEGSRTAMSGYTGMGQALSRMRVAESLEWKPVDGATGFGGAVESSLQFDRSPVGTLQWATTRVRPAYIASARFRVSLEMAHDQISSGFGVGGQRTAVTLAPTLTLGKSAGNANLRAFYTYSRASDVDGITFAAPADAWASQTSGSIFGVQLNRRW